MTPLVEWVEIIRKPCYNNEVEGGQIMQKKIKIWGVLVVTLGLLISADQAQATDFAGNEDEYTEMCQNTSSLSKSDLNVCQEYSTYLKNKNSTIEDKINSTQQALNQSLSDLDQARKQLSSTEQQIASIQSELAVLKGSIERLNQDITAKQEIVRERMYVLQTYFNGNELLSLLLSADSIDELFTRIQCIDELTTYDKELISGLARDKADLEEKNTELSTRYDELFALQSQQTALTNTLMQASDAYESDLQDDQQTLEDYRVDIGYIDASLSDAQKRLQAEEDRKKAEEEAKKEEETKKENENNNNTADHEPTDTPPSADQIGEALVATAYTKLGCDYVYGGTGPNSFDCSGFAQWVYKQNGIYIPRTVTSQYYACTLLDSPDLGDLVFFNTTDFLGHVGIYVGNGQFIHAGTSDTGVILSNFYSSYWQSVYQGAGRFR